MTATSIVRLVVPSLALVAAGGVALVLSITHARREPPIEGASVTAAPAISPRPSGVQDQGLTALATAQAEANNVTNALAVPPSSSGTVDEFIPVFDIARIEPSGDAVIAGRAPPGARVELLRDGEVHDRVVSGQSGQFVIVPPRLPTGTYELTLRSTLPNGKQETSKQSVVVAVQPGLKDRPVVALMTPDKASVVLSKPAMPNSVSGPVAVETVETESSGKLYVSGRSPPSAAVRLYLNDSYLASTTTAADGRFAFTINGGVGPGNYRARLDEVESGSGAIRSRAEVSFNVPETVAANGSVPDQAAASSQAHQGSPSPVQAVKRQDVADSGEPREAAVAPASAGSAPSVVVVPKITAMVVSRGDSLWRISRAAYGTGMRYAVIFGANHNQIRNPNRIYPGQIFVVPEQAR
jgi:nucleoid-associated protein YgaU